MRLWFVRGLLHMVATHGMYLCTSLVRCHNQSRPVLCATIGFVLLYTIPRPLPMRWDGNVQRRVLLCILFSLGAGTTPITLSLMTGHCLNATPISRDSCNVIFVKVNLVWSQITVLYGRDVPASSGPADDITTNTVEVYLDRYVPNRYRQVWYLSSDGYLEH